MFWDRLNVVLSIVLTLVLRVCCEINSKSGLVFVIDKTLSMGPVIEGVMESVTSIYDTVRTSPESPIDKFLLVQFGDPNVSDAQDIKDSESFINILTHLTNNLEDGDDCPELAMTGIETALNASPRGSFVYVFTDAPAKDFKMFERVKKIAQKKECQVVFILTLKCKDVTAISENYIVYPKLAEATSGQVFHMHEGDINLILDYVKDSIAAPRTTLHAEKYDAGENNTLSVECDSKTKDLTVSISATDTSGKGDIHVIITGPDGETIDEDAQRMGDIIILKVSDSVPGRYTVEFSCRLPSYVVVTARSDVSFRHGFSKKIVSSLDETDFGPFPGTKNYLYIRLFGDGITLRAAKFLKPNYNIILELPLKIQDERQKLYVTELFDPPPTEFRIAVKGLDHESKKDLTRYGNLVLEMVTFVDKTPTITVQGESKLTVDYHTILELNCSVEAYPEPRPFEWRDPTGKVLPSIFKGVPPYNSSILLKTTQLEKSTTFECYAENRLGSRQKLIQVEVKPKRFPPVVVLPKKQTLQYNEKYVLHCQVTSYPPSKISWKINRRKKALVKSGGIVMSADNSTLTINNMNLQARGKYQCIVEYLGKSKAYDATVTLSGKPRFEKPLLFKKIVKKGQTAELSCRLREGNPEPEIKWSHQFKDNIHLPSEVRVLDEETNKTSITIKNIDAHNAGTYKCVALNVVGSAERIIELIVEQKPTVTLSTTKAIVVKRYTEVYIKCAVEGAPSPTVRWLKNGQLITIDTSSTIKLFSDHSIRIKGNPHHTGKYTCNAVNELGTAEQSVQVTIYYIQANPPDITTFTRKVNENINIPCRNYFKGIPTPNLKWIFLNRTLTQEKSRRRQRITLNDGNLIIARIRSTDAGTYTCEASKYGEPKRISFVLDVLFPPKILTMQLEYDAVVGDRHLKIFCNAVGNPKPAITWEQDLFSVALGADRLPFEKNWLAIQNVDVLDRGEYKCKAKNDVFEAEPRSKPINVRVHRSPPPNSINKDVTTSLVQKGSTQPIECSIPLGLFDSVNWYKDGKLHHKGKLELSNAVSSYSGVYTCRVNTLNSTKKQNANTTVIVGYKPTFVNDPPETLEKYRGEEVSLDCQVNAEPLPIVSWWFNDKPKIFSRMELPIVIDPELVGNYKCEVKNDFGSIFRTFNVVLKEFTECILQIDKGANNQPLIITTSSAWPEFKTEYGYTTIPKHENIIFYCPSKFLMSEQTDLQAICYGGTEFFVKANNLVFNYADIKCEQYRPKHVMPKRDGKNIPCQGDKTITFKLFFGEHSRIDAMEYCLDKHRNVIYAKYIIRSPADYIPQNTAMWDGTSLDSYSSDKQRNYFSNFLFDTTECCFAKRHLVSPKDLFPGPLQRAAYNQLNIVPHWSTCHSENWDEVENNVRRLAKSIGNDLIIYTGIAENLLLNSKKGIRRLALKKQPIGTYLWKVIQHPTTSSSVAIVQLNIPEVKPTEVHKYIRCRDICSELPWMRGGDWHNVENGYTYCCDLRDFMYGFDKMNKVLFEPHYDLLRG